MKTLEREPDERLIEAAQSEPARFAELYEQNFARVYAFFARRVGTREEAQDLTSEVFHQALASIRSFKWQGAPFIAWLYGIAANVLSKHWQKLGRNPALEEPALAEEETDLSAAGDEIERSVMLAELVESLPARPTPRGSAQVCEAKEYSRNRARPGPQRRRGQAASTPRAGEPARETREAGMNPLVGAEEVDRQIENLFSGGNVVPDGEPSSLLAIASDLRLLPDSDFKNRLRDNLIDQAAGRRKFVSSFTRQSARSRGSRFDHADAYREGI